jgi:hypothetical protein
LLYSGRSLDRGMLPVKTVIAASDGKASFC